MSKQTVTKMMRRFEIVDKQMVERPAVLNGQVRETVGICLVCGNPVFASPGQLIRVHVKGDEKKVTHKKCRRDYIKGKI